MAMKVEMAAIETLSHADYNPRQLKKKDFAEIKKSIEKFGFVEPIIVNQAPKRKGIIIGGNQRFEVAKALGFKEIPVNFVNIPKLEEEKELNIRLNRNHGEWDWDLLSSHFNVEELIDWGFSQKELDYELDLKEEDEIPAIPKVAQAKRGELYQLGSHRLLCGDSTDEQDVKFLMDGQKASLISTDPPYLIDYTGGDRPKGVGKDWSNVYHEIDIENADQFLRDFLKNALAISKDNVALYIWHSDRRRSLLEKIGIGEELGILWHQTIIWVKPSPILTYKFYPYQQESCLFGWKKGFKPNHNLKISGDMTDVWQIDYDGKKKSVLKEHPTQKLLKLFTIPILNHTEKNDICYEPFSGSGSQIIACEQTQRRCYALEIEPVFVDVAIKRFCNFTNSNPDEIYKNALK